MAATLHSSGPAVSCSNLYNNQMDNDHTATGVPSADFWYRCRISKVKLPHKTEDVRHPVKLPGPKIEMEPNFKKSNELHSRKQSPRFQWEPLELKKEVSSG